MRKPIRNFYTIVWIEVPDQPAQPPRQGTRAVSTAALARWRNARARASQLLQGPRWTGAMTTLGLFFAHH